MHETSKQKNSSSLEACWKSNTSTILKLVKRRNIRVLQSTALRQKICKLSDLRLPKLEFSDCGVIYRSSHSEVFLGKGVLKIYSKFTGEHPCRSVISIKLQSNFIEISLWHGCSPVNLLHILRTPFLKNTSGWLLLHLQ